MCYGTQTVEKIIESREMKEMSQKQGYKYIFRTKSCEGKRRKRTKEGQHWYRSNERKHPHFAQFEVKTH